MKTRERKAWEIKRNQLERRVFGNERRIRGCHWWLIVKYISIKTEPSCSTLQETPLQTKANRSTAAMCNQQLLDSFYNQSCNQLSALSLSLHLSDYPALHAAPTSAGVPCRQSNILQNTWKGRGGDETSAQTNNTSALI